MEGELNFPSPLGPFTTDSFNWLVNRAGQKAKLPFQCHAHMRVVAVAGELVACANGAKQ
jgi:hypothetical protein